MLNEAQISLTGYVATQPLMRTLTTGVTTLSMRVAWTPRRRDRVTGEWADGNTSYVTVNCWRRLASNVAICVRKGDPVTIQGRVTVRSYVDKEGRPRIVVEIDASSVGHDLSYGVSEFRRIRPKTGMTASEFAAAQNASAQNASAHSADGQGGSGGADSAQGEAERSDRVADADASGNGSGTSFGGFGTDGGAPALRSAAPGGAGGAPGDDASGNWADGDGAIPMPDEPDQEFFDDPASGEGAPHQPQPVAS